MENKLAFVRKRDGRIVPFDKQKIADAIFKAARSIGGQDKYLAEDLAEAVRLYLVKECGRDMPSVEDIQDIVERVLIKTGHAKTAKAYILYREKRARVRRIREGIKPEDADVIEKERQNLIRNINLSVRESNDNISLWNKERIVEALVRETGLSRNISELIVGEVEEDVLTSKVRELSASLIRELVNAKLIAYGFENERNRHSRLGVPVYDVNRLFEEEAYMPDALSLKLGRHIKKEFALLNIIPDRAVEKHLTGEMRIHNLEGIDKFYSVSVSLEDADLEQEGKISSVFQELSVFVEGDIIFSLPSSGVRGFSDMKIPEIPRLKIEAGIDFLNSSGGIPFILRIDKTTDVSLFAGIRGRIDKLDIIKTGFKDGVIMNKITLDISHIQDSPDFDSRIKELLLLCSGVMEKQQSFMERIHLNRHLPEKLLKGEKAVEIALANVHCPAEDTIKRISDMILDFPAVFSFEVDFDKKSPLDSFSIINHFSGKGCPIRLYYV
ncbi:MAG TPA: ATP cone domain-containing protein [bacterium]|nr:ATP cone domain-containing protein [bacterium]